MPLKPLLSAVHASADFITIGKTNLPMRPAVMARFLMLGGMGYLYSSLAVNAVAECANTRKRYPLAVPIFLTKKSKRLQNVFVVVQ